MIQKFTDSNGHSIYTMPRVGYQLSGWQWWLQSPPPLGILIEVEGRNGERLITTADALSPFTNSSMLLWRLTGIGKEQLQ